MSRLGTCRHCHQIQERWIVSAHRQPHEPAEIHETQPESYTCQWLDAAGDLPPAISRWNGGFDLRDGDCEACSRYEPAGGFLLGQTVVRG